MEPHVKPYVIVSVQTPDARHVIVNVQILGYKMAVAPVLMQDMC